jgi:hypothetical protein
MIGLIFNLAKANWQRLLKIVLLLAAAIAGAVVLVSGWAAAGYIALPVAIRMVLVLSFALLAVAVAGWLVICSLGA